MEIGIDTPAAATEKYANLFNQSSVYPRLALPWLLSKMRSAVYPWGNRRRDY